MVNQAFEQLTGYSMDELQSIDWARTLTPPEWEEFEQQVLNQLIETGQPIRYEKEYLRKNGTRVPIELLVHLVRDKEGNPEYFYSFVTDITERKRGEQALQESDKMRRLALEASHAGAWSWNLRTNNLQWSEEYYRIFGLEPGSIHPSADVGSIVFIRRIAQRWMSS
jgi:PAS domain S-box-containing protein